jgi:putative pyruvate formate lyase activating enzyme
MFRRSALSHYDAVVRRTTPPHFKTADLEARVAAARDTLAACELCEHLCHADRSAGEVGTCGTPGHMLVASYGAHYGEEFFLVPSFTVFFASCSFRCQYCQNWQIARPQSLRSAAALKPTELGNLIDLHTHCRNVNFVGGEPTPHLPDILATLRHVTSDLPVVWNSNFYMSLRAMDLLSGVVDVYLSDFKYGNDHCAARLSHVKDYGRIVRRNHILAAADADLVIRHLLLPGHTDCCCKPVLAFIADHFGSHAIVNLMDQYRPRHRAERFPELTGRLSQREFEAAVAYADRLGLNYIT